jgi:hypothetical protein
MMHRLEYAIVRALIAVVRIMPDASGAPSLAPRSSISAGCSSSC